MPACATGEDPAPSSRRQLSSHGPEASALLDEIRASTVTLAALLAHTEELGDQVSAAVRAAIDEVEAELERRELRVVVVGQAGSGKSTLIDALLGTRLLGQSPTHPNLLVWVRRGPEPGYRARFASGRVEDFASRVHDPRPELVRRREIAEADQEDLQRTAELAEKKAAVAADRLRRLERGLADAFAAFEKARESASQLRLECEVEERRTQRLAMECAERQALLPWPVRQLPPWWALWLWMVRLLVLLFTTRAVRNHREVVRERSSGEARLEQLRAMTSRAAEDCAKLEAELPDRSSPVEEARRALAGARLVADQAGVRVRERAGQLEQLREALTSACAERQRGYVDAVRELCDAEGRGRDLIELAIEYPAALLPEDIVLIDAPGATAGDGDARERAWRVIAQKADGCILVSELERAVSGVTQKSLEQLREVVPHAILILTKTEECLAAAVREGDPEPWERVAQARRVGTRRFARELGRDASTVLSITVDAAAALRENGSAAIARRRFEAAVEKLFLLLRQERALILGSRSAGTVRRCIDGASEAETRAELAYQERILQLNARRTPEPQRFLSERMQMIEPLLVTRACSVVAAGLGVWQEGVRLVRVQCAQWIAACARTDELRGLGPRLAEAMAQGLSRARDEMRAHVALHADRALRELESPFYDALRQRYQLLHQIGRAPGALVDADWPRPDPIPEPELGRALEQGVRSFGSQRVAFGFGGTAVGAALGTLILPGLGSVAGAMLGSLATFAKTLASTRRTCAKIVDDQITELERALAPRSVAGEVAVADAMRACLMRSSEDAIARFGRWMAEPLEEERAAIEHERAKLEDMQRLHRGLEQHGQQLQELIRKASDASLGLCR